MAWRSMLLPVPVVSTPSPSMVTFDWMLMQPPDRLKVPCPPGVPIVACAPLDTDTVTAPEVVPIVVVPAKARMVPV